MHQGWIKQMKDHKLPMVDDIYETAVQVGKKYSAEIDAK
jgi:hypothetical protein